MSVLLALEWHYFQELLNWWHSPFKGWTVEYVEKKITFSEKKFYTDHITGQCSGPSCPNKKLILYKKAPLCHYCKKAQKSRRSFQ
jgi:hypothetical protein